IFALRHEDDHPLKAVPLLLAATHDANARVRREAGTTLANFHDWGPDEVAAFICLLKDPDPRVQEEARVALYQMRDYNRQALARTLISEGKGGLASWQGAAKALDTIGSIAAMEGGTKLAEAYGIYRPDE